MGKKIEEAEQEFERLMTTRKRALERPLRKIDELRRQREIEPAAARPFDEAGPGADAGHRNAPLFRPLGQHGDFRDYRRQRPDPFANGNLRSGRDHGHRPDHGGTHVLFAFRRMVPVSLSCGLFRDGRVDVCPPVPEEKGRIAMDFETKERLDGIENRIDEIRRYL